MEFVFFGGALVNQGILLQFAWAQLVSQIPKLLGCIALGMSYYDWTMSAATWLFVNGFSDATAWATGHVATYFGDKAGNIVVTTAAAYAAFLGIMFGVLACGWLFRQLTTQFPHASPRRFPRWKCQPTHSPYPTFSTPPSGVRGGDAAPDSDTGTASSSNGATRVLGRLKCQENCVCIPGL